MKLLLFTQGLLLQTGETRTAGPISLNVKAGETVVLRGVDEIGQEALFRYLSGEAARCLGCVRILEQESKTEYLEDKFTGSIYRAVSVSGWKPRCNPELSAAEYLFLFAPLETHGFFWLSDKMNRQAEELLRSYGIRIRPDAKAAELEPSEFRLLDLLRARISGASFCLLREDFEGYTGEALRQLSCLLQRLKQEGMGFLLLTHGNKGICETADRLVLFQNGRIVKKLLSPGAIAEALQDEKTFASWFERTGRQQEVSGGNDRFLSEISGQEQRGYRIRRVDSEKTVCFPFGDIVNVVAYRLQDKWRIFDILRGNRGRNGIIYEMDSRNRAVLTGSDVERMRIASLETMESGRELFRNLTTAENLILPGSRKLRKREVFLHRKNESAVKRMLEQQYGQELPDRVDDLTAEEKVLVCLERWKIYRPSVIVLLEPYLQAGEQTKTIIRSYLQKFAEDGCAVILVTSSKSMYQTIAGHCFESGELDL